MKFKLTLEAFNDSYIPEPNSGCWLWIGTLNENGYGVLQSGGYRGYAHRYSFMYHMNTELYDLFVCHHCDVPSCVNPDHLFLGTHADNIFDCLYKNRHVTQKEIVNYSCGETHFMSKLDDDKVREIRKLYAIHSQRKLAEMFGVTKNAIKLIVDRKTWKHVQD